MKSDLKKTNLVEREGESAPFDSDNKQAVQGGYDSKLIPIVNASSNCVRLNDRDTAVAVFNRSGTQAVSAGTQISGGVGSSAATCSHR